MSRGLTGSARDRGTAGLRQPHPRTAARPRQQHCTLLPSAIASHGDQGGGSHDHGGHVLSPQVISSILLSYSSFEQQSRPIPPDLTRLYPLLLQALCLAAAAGSPGPPPRASPKVVICSHVYCKFCIGFRAVRVGEARLLDFCVSLDLILVVAASPTIFCITCSLMVS